jgi:hypothetical protein
MVLAVAPKLLPIPGVICWRSAIGHERCFKNATHWEEVHGEPLHIVRGGVVIP